MAGNLLTHCRTRGYNSGGEGRMILKSRDSNAINMSIKSFGGFGEAAPPVSIPNTEVKRLSAHDTALVTAWENRSLPGGFLFPEIIFGIMNVHSLA